MIGSHYETHGVRNDHPDESDHAAERHDRPGQQRRHEKDGSLGPFRIDPERSRGFLTQSQNVLHSDLFEQQHETDE